MSRKLLLGAISKEVAAKFLKDRGRELAEAITAALPEHYRYVLILGAGDELAFFSAASREVVIEMLEAVLERLKAASPSRGSSSSQG